MTNNKYCFVSFRSLIVLSGCSYFHGTLFPISTSRRGLEALGGGAADLMMGVSSVLPLEKVASLEGGLSLSPLPMGQGTALLPPKAPQPTGPSQPIAGHPAVGVGVGVKESHCAAEHPSLPGPSSSPPPRRLARFAGGPPGAWWQQLGRAE